MSTLAYRQKNKEKIAAYNKAWNAAHPNYKKEYDEANRERINARRQQYRKNNHEKTREQERQYRKNNPEVYHAKDRRDWLRQRVPIVYVFRNTNNEVIYVGRGTRRRLSWHKAYAPWWSEVANIKTRKCASWANSLVLEALLIRKYQPRYNKEGVTQ
jgi:hypothetical protein